MLKNIRLHIDSDETKQGAVEASRTVHIEQTFKRNLQAFQLNIPSLVPYIRHAGSTNSSIFCNKFGEENIVDYGTGRTLYGLHPTSEIQSQYQVIREHCPYMAFSEGNAPSVSLGESEHEIVPGLATRMAQPQLPKDIDTLVVLGIGLGHHLIELINHHNIRHLAIYEPDIQYFRASTFCIDWCHILDSAKRNETGLYIQIEKDGRDLIKDIEELDAHFSISGFYLYKHYNHPVFNEVEQACLNNQWQTLKQKCIEVRVDTSASTYVPAWTPAMSLRQQFTLTQSTKQRFAANMKAFKRYFPAIHGEFTDYEPSVWFPIENECGEINLVKRNTLNAWYGDSPKADANVNFEGFSQHPNKDNLILGYTGTKLKHYTHYQFVEKTQKLLEDVVESQGALPTNIKALILFGISAGYQVEELFTHHTVDKLFICEPNRDFFYASLYAIDWEGILTKVDKSGGRLYINIGDDGTNLFRDLLNQFYAIGPYVLANTYFYQGYYNTALVEAIAQLREQLKVVISVGEYYDHARFGIAHTSETLRRGYPHLIANPERIFSTIEKEVPVFFVGNGPSLDEAIETIKEWKDQAIIVSCGTSLMPLYKNGIVPDFHAEIEQNRSSYDWICRIGDFDFLKQISLVSCNGIHPDTCDLFKDVYIAFKEGESSTVSALEILGRENYSELQFAFPTVSNFALNLFTTLGCNQLYLFGIDLGFYDKKKHHSTQSGYYKESGEELYDYEAKNNTSILVPGNFRKTVFTKYEFKVSKMLIEQSLSEDNGHCFNCSDGAKIEGAQPLKLEDVLLIATRQEKQQVLTKIKRQAFVAKASKEQYQRLFDAKYKRQKLLAELASFIDKADVEFTSLQQVERFIEKQKEMLFSSYQQGKSLLFFLLYGTVNYANSIFSKLQSADDNDELMDTINQARKYWHGFLKQVSQNIPDLLSSYDSTSSLHLQRERTLLADYFANKRIAYWVPSYLHETVQKKFAKALPSSTTYLFIDDISQAETLSGLILFCNQQSEVATIKHKVESLSALNKGHADLPITVGVADFPLQQAVEQALRSVSGNLRVSYVIFPPAILNQEEYDEFARGERPYFLRSKQPVFALKAHVNNALFYLQLPKCYYAINERVSLANGLPAGIKGQPVNFKGYLAFAEDGELPALLDLLGNRGESHTGERAAKSYHNSIYDKETVVRLKKAVDAEFL